MAETTASFNSVMGKMEQALKELKATKDSINRLEQLLGEVKTGSKEKEQK